MKKLLFIILLLGLYTSNFAQKNIDSAQLYFNQRKFALATEILNRQLTNQPNKDHFVLLGKAYNELRMFDKALYAFNMASDYGSFNTSEKELFLTSLKNNGKYKEARLYLLANTNFGQKDINILDSIENWTEAKSNFTIDNLPINTTFSDFSLTPYVQNTLLFSSDRQKALKTETDFEYNNVPHLNLFTTNIAQLNQNYPKVSEFSKNTTYHDATSSFDPINNKLYISRNYTYKTAQNINENKLSKLKIIIIDIDSNGKVKKETEFPFNDNNYNFSHPFIDHSGQKLYFVSDIKGGLGGTDIYFSDLDSKGNWSIPKNLGANINTASNEMFPFISQNNTLYFSSEGHVGMGGLDIFSISLQSRVSSQKPKNIGIPFNSSFDDFSFYSYTNALDSGYFSSNRPGGMGLDDIYKFVNKKSRQQVLKPNSTFVVNTKDIETNNPLGNVTLKLKDLTLGTELNGLSDSKGLTKFQLFNGHKYQLTALSPKYLTNTFDDIMPIIGSYDVFLQPKTLNKAFEIKNIYYNFNQSYIHPDAVPNLIKLTKLLKNNPDIKIELSSHTDSRGEDSYNMDLSQKRAESVVNFLIKDGISPDRMIAKGYGETKLVNNCKNNVPCPESKHIINRRTEFKIIGIDNKEINSSHDKVLASHIMNKSSRDASIPILSESLQESYRDVPIPTKDQANADQNISTVNTNYQSSPSEYYTIQVGAFGKPSSSFDVQYPSIKLNYLNEKDKYLAIFGIYNSEADALAHLDHVRTIFPASFVIKVQDGKRMTTVK